MVLAALIPLTILLVAIVAFRPGITVQTGGKVLAFFALLVFPTLLLAGGFKDHMETSTSTEFCLSCHVMEPYYESMLIDEDRHIPAVHYQNRTVPRDKACFTCHTKYTIFGDLDAKLAGLQHLWVYYMEEIPEKIELYEPYRDRECLHCHVGARSYEAQPEHVGVAAKLEAGELRCFSCHFKKHSVHELDKYSKWTDPDDPR